MTKKAPVKKRAREHERKENPVPRLPAKREKPKGGWPATVKSARHGSGGEIEQYRNRKAAT